MRSVNVVPCPCCKKELYRSLKVENGSNQAMSGTPHLDQDESGQFMKCPHCLQRITMRSVPSSSGLAEFGPSDIQPCNKKLP
jgi:hypothetical protein